jgi:hypothetical protein
MADDLGLILRPDPSRKRFLARKVPRGGVVQSPYQVTDGCQKIVPEEPVVDHSPGHIAFEKCQHVTTESVASEIPRGSIKGGPLQVIQIGRDRVRLGLMRAPHGIADSHHALGDITGGKLDFPRGRVIEMAAITKLRHSGRP